MAGLRTEFDFVLPKGYVGDDGVLHRRGTMRLATARDEIEPLRDRSIDGPDDPYLTILVLARVVSRLGELSEVGVEEVEGLFAADLAFLQDLYGIVNFGDHADVEALQASVLPEDGGPERVAEPAPDTASDDDEFGIVTIDDDGEIVAEPADRPTPARRSRASVEEVPASSPAPG